MKTIKKKLLSMLALMLCMGAMLFSGATAYAADIQVEMEDISMENVWITGETLCITIPNESGDEPQILEFNLRDYATPDDEHVTVQAVDAEGHILNAVQLDNPYYVPQPDSEDNVNIVMIDNDISDETLPEGANPTGDGRPFTPDGTGTVLDNATDGDGKEFFTIETPDGNIFYLVIDRQRSTDNVYLLNTVTEAELMALAEKNGNSATNGNSDVVDDPNQSDEQPPTPPSPEPENKPSEGGSISVSILIVIAIVVIGGTGYYFKIVRPKQLGGDSYDDEDEQEEDFDDDFNEDEELDIDNDDEESD